MLRPAREDDRTMVLPWRNHPDVRAMSLTRHVIAPGEHERWWGAALADPGRRVLIYERDGVPCGVVTFFDLDLEADAGTGWWGYYLDGEGLQERGQLLPAWIEIQRQAVRYAFDELKLQELHGEVLAENEAVRSFNRRLGFVETAADRRIIDGEPVEVIRFCRSVRPPATTAPGGAGRRSGGADR